MMSLMYLSLNENISHAEFESLVKQRQAEQERLLAAFDDRLAKCNSDAERSAFAYSVLPVLSMLLML